MRPPAEQVVRDYLDRLSVAARSRLPTEDRHAFLVRIHDQVERQSGVRDMADPADVMRALSGIGEPETLVERERARLQAKRKEREAAAGRIEFWKPPSKAKGKGRRFGTGLQSFEHLIRPDGRPVTGEIKVTTRPMSSRWRPGQSLNPKPKEKPKRGRGNRVPPPPPEDSPQPGRSTAEDSSPPTSEQHPSSPVGPVGAAGAAAAGAADAARTDSAGVGVTGSGNAAPGGSAPGSAAPAWPGSASTAGPTSTGTAAPNGAWSSRPGTAGTGGTGTASAAPAGTGSAAPAGTGGTAPTGTGSVAPAGSSGGAAGSGGAGAAWPGSSGTVAPDTNAPVGSGGAGPAGPDGSATAGQTPTGSKAPPEVVLNGVVLAPGTRTAAEDSGPAPAWTGGAEPPATSAGQAPTRRLRRPPRPQLPRRLQPGDLTRDMARRAADAGRQHRLEVVLVVMMALGGLILPWPIWAVGLAMWLLGALIAATSRLWSLPDKWLGLVGPVALAIIGTAVAVSLSGTRSSPSGYLHETLTNSMYLFKIGAVLGAAFLAWRIYRPRRPSSVIPWLWRRHT